MTKLVECMRKRVRQFIAVKWVFSCREKKCNLLSFTNVSHTFLIDDFFLKTLEAKKWLEAPGGLCRECELPEYRSLGAAT